MSPPAPAAPSARAPWALRGLFAIALIFALREAQTVLAPVAIAVVLTFVLVPLVRGLRRVGVPEMLGAGLVVLTLIGATGVMATSLAEPAQAWWRDAPRTMAQLMQRLDKLRESVPGLEPPKAPASAPPPVRSTARTAPAPVVPATPEPPPDPVKQRLASEGVAITGMLLGRGLSIGVATAATMILLYFLLASEHWILSRLVEAVPRRRSRALLLGGARAAQREIGRYLFALGCINAGAGAITGLGLWQIGLPNPTLWGVVAAVLCFIPYIGPMIVMALLLVAGMTTFTEWPQMFGPLAVFAAVHAVESNLFSPWFVGRRLSLSPISVFLAVMFWGWLWGIAGALMAVPLLIGMRCVCQRTRRGKLLCRLLEGDKRTPPSLRSLLRQRWRRAGAVSVPRPVRTSELVNVAEAGHVDVVPTAGAREPQLVARPLEHDA